MSDHWCLIIHCCLIENDNQFMEGSNVRVRTGAIEIYPLQIEGDRLRTHMSGGDFSLVPSKVSCMLEVNDYAAYVNRLNSVFMMEIFSLKN